ncbi:MAG: efflux RND transporter periplasmic adaptor subunit [Spirochaetales bacterium]|nr:efflux RND transporter periplasmic adaptor subunit [Spirochaetales bacterium]
MNRANDSDNPLESPRSGDEQALGAGIPAPEEAGKAESGDQLETLIVPEAVAEPAGATTDHTPDESISDARSSGHRWREVAGGVLSGMKGLPESARRLNRKEVFEGLSGIKDHFLKNPRRWAAGVASVAGVLILISLFSGEEITESAAMVQEVETIPVQKETLTEQISSPGTVTYLNKASISARIEGRVQTINKDMGDRVAQGEVLAQLETTHLALQLQQAQARLTSAVAGMNLAQARLSSARRSVQKQIQSLDVMQANILDSKANYLQTRQNLQNKYEVYELGGLSRMDMRNFYNQYLTSMTGYFKARKDFQGAMIGFRDADLKESRRAVPADGQKKRDSFIEFNTEVEKSEVAVAQSGIASAQAEVQSAQYFLTEATIKSPIAGVVASRGLDIGEEVKTGEPFFTVVRLDRVVVTTNVAEEDLGRITAGQSGQFTIDANGGESLIGQVARISPVIDPVSRTAEIRIELDNEKEILRPGMFVRCKITTREKPDGIAVPTALLLNVREEEGERKADVFIYKNGAAFKKTVTVGGLFGDRTEVISGLQPGDELIRANLRTLKDGAPVRVRPGVKRRGE